MGKQREESRKRNRLLNVDMEQKFKKSFTAINIGFIIVTVIALSNVAMYASMAGVNIFTSLRGVIALILLLIGVVINLVLCIRVSKSLSAAMVTPIRELQNAVRKLKAGEFDIEIMYEGRDEFGELAEDLQEACSRMKEVVADAGYVLGEMAEGRFDVSSKMEDGYVGEFKTLIFAMEKLNLQLDGTLRQIRDASEQVMSGSEQMAGSAQELADGATNQAGAVEELTATIENVANISEESADNAAQAAMKARAAAEDAEKSREEMNQLAEAMGRITDTSKEIENIIVAIEDIASQTNLLSLNASIEAARAGEAGRGFAVVADQIGKLAADSAQSAVTTRELISKSLTEVGTGNQMVENTLESIGTVLANMKEFAEMASESAEASKVQADLLKQIEAGIEQISSVVQSNSASAQETSAISEELSAQSVGLEEMVAQFVLRKQ